VKQRNAAVNSKVMKEAKRLKEKLQLNRLGLKTGVIAVSDANKTQKVFESVVSSELISK
jgi:hypothetical protein